MLRGARIPLAAILVALCALAVLAPTGAGRGAPAVVSATLTPLGGVNIGGLSYGARAAEADRAIAGARKLHAKLVRIELPWAVLEPRAANRVDPGALAYTDRLMSDASVAGIAVIATVDNTPCWASTAPAPLLSKCSPTTLHAANAWPPRDPASYGAVVSYLTRRYGKSLAAIEVWNEPDQANEHYFAGPHKARRYAKVLRAAYQAVKQADPAVSVLAGSLVGSNGVFLRALYAAGIKGFYDGLAVHFYNLTLASVRSIREIQTAHGDTAPLWLDEFGWTSCWPRERTQQEQACVTPGIQRLNITNVFRSLARTGYIAAEVIYQLRDQPKENFGVLSSGGRRKPAFFALRGVLASPSGPVSPVTLRLHSRAGRILAAGGAPVGDYMRLEVLKGATLRYTALFTLNRFNRYSITLPRVLGTRGLRVRVFQYWTGIAEAAQKSI